LTAPFFGGQVVHLDADKVKDIKLTVRTRYELRNFHFERVGKDKDKTWVDKTGLQEFQIDQDKVNRFVKEFSKVHSDRFVAFTGGPRDEHKLGAKEATARIEMTTEDGKSVTLTIGARYQTHGYYATSSYWPGTVFMLPFATVDPILAGPEQFAKERAGVD
jgi:hypothetical protein